MLGGFFRPLPAGQERDARHRARDMTPEAAHGGLGHLFGAGALCRLHAGNHHVGLQHDALQANAVRVQLIEHRLQGCARHGFAARNVMRAVHQHLGLDDRHDARLLAQRGVTRERVRVGIDAGLRRNAIRDVDDGPPLGEASAELVILRETLAQAVEALGDGLARKAGERLRSRVDLDAGNDAVAGEVLGERHPVPGLLTQRLVVKDDGADVVGSPRRREQQLAIGAATLLARFQLDLVEALLDGAARFVRRENALVFGHHGARDGVQLGRRHAVILRLNPLAGLAGCMPREGRLRGKKG